MEWTPPPAPTPSVKLWCMLDTGSEVFGVEVPVTADIDTLKERIKAKNPTDLQKIDARHLRLVKVTNTDGTPVAFSVLDNIARQQVADAARAVETGVASSITYSMLAPFYTLEDCSLARSTPRGFVDILVVLPQETASFSVQPEVQNDPTILNVIDRRVAELLASGSHDSIAFSDINSNQWQLISERLNFQLVPVPVYITQELLWSADAFLWSDSREDDAEQRDRCIKHCQKIFVPEGSTAFQVQDVANNKTFLKCNIGQISFRGTTDAAIWLSGFNVLLAVVEFKQPKRLKEQLKKSRYQTVCELLAADQVSDLGVIAVLTDLQDYWELFWIMDPADLSTEMRTRDAMVTADLVIAYTLLARDQALSIIHSRLSHIASIYAVDSSTAHSFYKGPRGSGDRSKNGREGLQYPKKARWVWANRGSGGASAVPGAGGGVGEDLMHDVYDVMTDSEVFEYEQRNIVRMVQKMVCGQDIQLKQPLELVASH